MISANWTRENLAWLSGLLDGEGSFSILEQDRTDKRRGRNVVRRNRSYRISMNLTDEDLVRRAHAVAGVGHVYGPRLYSYKAKPAWVFEVGYRSHVYALCAAIYPWMGHRRAAKMRDIFASIVRHSAKSSYRKANADGVAH